MLQFSSLLVVIKIHQTVGKLLSAHWSHLVTHLLGAFTIYVVVIQRI